jgi:predicted transcriptional regulator
MPWRINCRRRGDNKTTKTLKKRIDVYSGGFVLTLVCPPVIYRALPHATVEGRPTMNESNTEAVRREDVMRMAVDIVAAYLSRNQLPTTQIPEVITTIVGSLDGLDRAGAAPAAEPQKPRVPIRRSVTPDFVICLEDGKKLKMLKRHLRTAYNMTPEEYRAKWRLPPDYPMVAPNYSMQRSEFARKIGLGLKPTQRRRRAPRK